MSIAKKALERIKPENRQFVGKSKALADQVFEVLKQKGMSQKDAAEKLGKQPSEISKWLSGMHNPTLRTITNLEVLLGTDLLITPSQARARFEKKEYVYMTVHAQPKTAVAGQYIPTKSPNRNYRVISETKGIKVA